MARILMMIAILLISSGYVCAQNKPGAQTAEKIANKIRQRAEKAGGTHKKLVKHKVTVKKGRNGQPVIEQIGEASFYSDGFQGKKTANGQRFDQKRRTAAHPILPLGTKATVTNLDNGKSVNVKINDRGPYVKGRDIDLSKSAAKKLGMTKDGLVPVKIEAQVPPEEKRAKE